MKAIQKSAFFLKKFRKIVLVLRQTVWFKYILFVKKVCNDKGIFRAAGRRRSHCHGCALEED